MTCKKAQLANNVITALHPRIIFSPYLKPHCKRFLKLGNVQWIPAREIVRVPHQLAMFGSKMNWTATLASTLQLQMQNCSFVELFWSGYTWNQTKVCARSSFVISAEKIAWNSSLGQVCNKIQSFNWKGHHNHMILLLSLVMNKFSATTVQFLHDTQLCAFQ